MKGPRQIRSRCVQQSIVQVYAHMHETLPRTLSLV